MAPQVGSNRVHERPAGREIDGSHLNELLELIANKGVTVEVIDSQDDLS